MMRPSRGSVYALASLAAALGFCMILPVLDPTCAMGSDSAGSLGACAATPASLGRQIVLMGVVIGSIGAGFLLASIGIQAALHHRISAGLRRQARPAVLDGHAVELVPGIAAAFVAGIRHPRIFCADDLATRVDAEELRAVLLHERHHELVHAPTRLVLLSALAPFVGRLGPGSAWVERQRARIEIAADEHAICNGATRATLARAILKLGDPQRPTFAGFVTARDIRLRALIGEDVGSTAASPAIAARLVLAGAVVTLLCSVLPLP